MTPLKQQISLIPFSIEHWYSPYKQQRFVLCGGYYPPAVPRTLKVLDKVKQPSKFQHRIFMHHAVMRICISHRLTYIGTT